MGRHVLITGAYGFLGRHAARRWAQAGWRVTGLGHGSWSREDWGGWGIDDWHSVDITLDALVTYAHEPDVVIHCAGSGAVSFSVTHPYQDFQRTVQTAAAVLEYVRTCAPRARVVLPSSAAVYGNAQSLPIRESAPLRPVSPYGVHKDVAERLAGSYARQFGIHVAIVRFFSIYGIGLRKQLLWDACRKFSQGETEFAGTGEELRDWLHISDATDLLSVAAEHAGVDCVTINGGSGSASSVREVLSRIASGFPGVPAPHFSRAARTGDPANFHADAALARSLGWSPKVDLDRGVEEYVGWFRQGAP